MVGPIHIVKFMTHSSRSIMMKSISKEGTIFNCINFNLKGRPYIPDEILSVMTIVPGGKDKAPVVTDIDWLIKTATELSRTGNVNVIDPLLESKEALYIFKAIEDNLHNLGNFNVNMDTDLDLMLDKLYTLGLDHPEENGKVEIGEMLLILLQYVRKIERGVYN